MEHGLIPEGDEPMSSRARAIAASIPAITSRSLARAVPLLAVLGSAPAAVAAETIPPASAIRPDRPRLLLRPADTPLAVSLGRLGALPRDDDFREMVRRLEGVGKPSALALVHRLTGRPEPAARAIEALRSWRRPGDGRSRDDPFNVFFTLVDLGLAYDWLHGRPDLDADARSAIREEVRPFAENAFRLAQDHVFHNYIWMYDGGAMLWALATAGEDSGSDALFARLRDRFDGQLFKTMEYLDGGAGDSAGYWWLYCQGAATLTVLAAQSAFETDLVGTIRREGGDWLGRQLESLVLGTLPDLRFAPWGDIVAGANGGVTHEMAGQIDALTWALRSPSGAFLARKIAERRGLDRYYGETGIFYFLYGLDRSVEPAQPPLAMRAGGEGGGHVLLRSDWGDGATVVGFRSTDFYGQHHHHDQGSFFIYRNGHLALDAGTYGKVGGPQARTDAHSTLLLGGEGQVRQTYQSASTLDEFLRRLPRGLETGDMPFYRHAGEWSAAAGRFAQAYSPEAVRSCVRQILFIRPGTVAVVDRLEAPEGRPLPEVGWLLQVPGRPELDGGTVTARNEKSFLRCRALQGGGREPRAEASYRSPAGPVSSGGNPRAIDASRVIYSYDGAPRLALVHLIAVGDGPAPPAAEDPAATVEIAEEEVRLGLGGRRFAFSAEAPFGVSEVKP
jgi:hypothetical protein